MVATAALLAFGTSTAAIGQPTAVVTGPAIERQFTRTVSFADLDLATPGGKKMLFRRVRSAVNSVCSELVGPSPLYFEEVGCRRATWFDTRPQMDRALSLAKQGSDQRVAFAPTAIKVATRR